MQNCKDVFFRGIKQRKLPILYIWHEMIRKKITVDDTMTKKRFTCMPL